MMLYLDFNSIKKGDGPGGKRFDGPELRSILRDLERELKDGPSGGFFMLEFPMSMIKHRNWVDLKSEFPGLDKWLERVYSREAWKRGLQKGNGYDLSVFPQKPHL
jgi:glutathione S-transferase